MLLTIIGTFDWDVFVLKMSIFMWHMITLNLALVIYFTLFMHLEHNVLFFFNVCIKFLFDELHKMFKVWF